MAKTMQQPLVLAHINSAKVAIIEQHLKCFREFIGQRKCGTYVLRSDGDIYYVGLASSLRSRLADHLEDHHRGKWNQFDLYMMRKGKPKYQRELEALLIRVAKPGGNKTEPKFIRYNNTTKEFEQALHREVAAFFARTGQADRTRWARREHLSHFPERWTVRWLPKFALTGGAQFIAGPLTPV